MRLKNFTTVLIGLAFSFLGLAQDYTQYFDGADTICNPNIYSSSICITIHPDSTNIWQIGPPQKTLFDSAATQPNAIVTDTIKPYPINNTSSFQYTIVPWTTWGILAIQWKQKLDMDDALDGGIIEFSVDSGNTWQNAFDNPHVYNFYGYDTSNVDSLQNGQMAFTGTDTTWKNIWLCYDMTWLNAMDSIMIRHTFTSDSIQTNKDGWIIDNMLINLTIVHTVNEIEQEKYMTVTPNPTSGRVYISTKKVNADHIIEKIELLNTKGQIVQEWGVSPTQFFIELNNHANGVYFLNVKTNIQTETFKIILER